MQVVLRNGEEYVGTYTVNIFNNAVVPEPTKAGYKFAGWSPKEDWTEGTDSEDLLSENTGLIRYDDDKGLRRRAKIRASRSMPHIRRPQERSRDRVVQ